jgi:hypothetical protein
MIKNYRKKPVVIQAVQFEGGYDSYLQILKFIGKIMSTDANSKTGVCNYVEIITLEGIMQADKGDFIIKGVKGEFYPCKPDIFEMTYEEVKD